MTQILETLETLSKYGIIDIVFGFGIIGLLLRGLRKYFPQNIEALHVHVQNVDIQVSNDLERYNTALGIFISNSGTSNIYIARAFFRPYSKRFIFLKRYTELKIYPKAFKSAFHNAYEIKFGKGWWEFDILIKPNNREMTYLPLSEPAKESVIKNRKCGTVILEYATAGKSGRYIVRV